MRPPDFSRRDLVRGIGGIAVSGWSADVAADKAPEPTRLVAAPLRALMSAASPPALSYRGSPAIPVVRSGFGDRVRLTLKNGLDEPTGVVWQGLRGDSVHAGDAAPLGLGGSTSIDLRPADSGTVWFHPPFVPGRSDQTARGLAGVLVVAEAVPPVVDADLLLFLGEGTANVDPVQRLSLDGTLVQGTTTFAPGARLRLRVVNGSTRRVVTVSFGGARPGIIAIDGQPSGLFRPLDDRIPIGPGSRFDVLVDMPRQPGAEFRVMGAAGDGAAPSSSASILVARPDGAMRPDYPQITALPRNPALPAIIPLEMAKRVDLAIGRSGDLFSVNGTTSIALPREPLFTVRRGTPVTLGIANRAGDLVGLDLRGQALRLLHSLDDGWEPYWRESVLVPPDKTVHAAFVPDVPGRWPISSPFFDQAVSGLQRWFEVI